MTKEALYYIKQFRLDQVNYDFNRQEFIDELSRNFLERLKTYPYKNPKTNCVTYNNFKRIITMFYTLYQSINASVGNKLTPGLWGAFYAQTVIPLRKSLYPRVQYKINTRNLNTIGEKVTLKHL